ncbi:hypothetical protein EDEG_03528 [Edhazardia aedis USNM 41457]|uniref:Uncharacterized protein n=1 Tax=Edhazardia aedis (strain USNM 41457) TaxID=1003232 RepID=J8ZQM7_EDHAE|nr:hypothetical protein EDEG_03528 [Edhazardia aedis USNM 41457]|eukprot:EJW02018.1 hypothetical protein EDEG_03528 [Edhazardia aedis USNM 41457]
MVKNLNNYHWTEADISQFTKQFIIQELKNLNYEIKKIDCEASITQRMGDVGFIYQLDIEAINSQSNRNIKIYNHDQYSDFSDLHEEDRKCFEIILNNWKSAAKTDRGIAVLAADNDKTTKNDSNASTGNLNAEKMHLNKRDYTIPTPVEINYDKCKPALIFKFRYEIICPSEQLQKYLFEPELIKIWTLGQFFKSDSELSISNTLFFTNVVQSNNIYTMKMKLKEWNKLADVKISFYDDKSISLVQVDLSNSPFDGEIAPRRLFNDLIFVPITKAFGLKITYK